MENHKRECELYRFEKTAGTCDRANLETICQQFSEMMMSMRLLTNNRMTLVEVHDRRVQSRPFGEFKFHVFCLKLI